MRHNLFLWNTLERTPSNFRYIMYNYGTVVPVTLITSLQLKKKNKQTKHNKKLRKKMNYDE